MCHSVAVTMRERRARSQREEDVGQRSLLRRQLRGGDYPRLDSCCPWARDSGLRKGSRSALAAPSSAGQETPAQLIHTMQLYSLHSL